MVVVEELSAVAPDPCAVVAEPLPRRGGGRAPPSARWRRSSRRPQICVHQVPPFSLNTISYPFSLFLPTGGRGGGRVVVVVVVMVGGGGGGGGEWWWCC
jgi:hypothetical protein